MSTKSKRGGAISVLVYIAVIAVLGWGTMRVYHWFTSRSVGAAVEASVGKIEQARTLISEGKQQEAKELLLAVAEKPAGDNVGPSSLMLLAEMEETAGNKPQAIAYLERITQEFPTSADRPKALLQYAKLLESDSQFDKAKAVYEELRASAPADLRAPATTRLAKLTESAGNSASREAAREMYRQALQEASVGSAAWEEALDALGAVNVALVFSPEPTSDSETYVLEKGDSITSIGNKKNTTQGMLLRANNLTEDARLDVGQRLKYTPKDFRIIIERSTCKLYLLDNKGVFKRYYTGLGMPGHETTLGSYKIGNKEKDPVWHKPGAGPIPSGDPANELGTRWMPLVPVQEALPKDLGIHGTIRPETVGGYASHGCARLVKDDVEELYDLVVRSTPVDIVETVTPEMLQVNPGNPAG